MLHSCVLDIYSLIVRVVKYDPTSKNFFLFRLLLIESLLDVSVIDWFVAFAVPVFWILRNRAKLFFFFFRHFLLLLRWSTFIWCRLGLLLVHFASALRVILSNYSLLVVSFAQLLIHLPVIFFRLLIVLTVLYMFNTLIVLSTLLTALRLEAFLEDKI